MANRRKSKKQHRITPHLSPKTHSGTQQHGVISKFSGPLPPPEILAQYNQLTPDAADRIITMAETEASHRRELEQKVIDGEIKNEQARNIETKTGQVLGFIIGTFTVGCGTYAAVSGAEIAGGFIGTGGVASLVTVFIYGRKTK